jgi:hypothetical protein
MPTIRELLDLLASEDTTTIDRLCWQRQQPRTPRSTRCAALARSFSGDLEALVGSLRKREIRFLLGRIIPEAGRRTVLQEIASRSTEELAGMALSILGEGRVPTALAPPGVSS